QLFNPDKRCVGAHPNVDLDVTALIMSPVVADFLAARAKARDGNTYAENEVSSGRLEFSNEAAFVVHKPDGSGRGCRAAEEVRETDFQASCFCTEAATEFAQDAGDRMSRNFAAPFVEHLQETTHMRSLDVGTKAHR